MELDELVSDTQTTINLISGWISETNNTNEVVILPCIQQQGERELLRLQVTTHSTLGAVAYSTGGFLAHHGWLRILGAGNDCLTRTITSWNEQCGTSGLLLVADDVLGGFFAINGGYFGEGLGNLYYFAPDTLQWENMNMGYTDFIRWVCAGDLSRYYESLRWRTWEKDIQGIHGDQGISIFPPLWTKQGNIKNSERKVVPIYQLWEINKVYEEKLKNVKNGDYVQLLVDEHKN